MWGIGGTSIIMIGFIYFKGIKPDLYLTLIGFSIVFVFLLQFVDWNHQEPVLEKSFQLQSDQRRSQLGSRWQCYRRCLK